MPTSSQALLLKSTSGGTYPTMFGLRFWQPGLSERLSAPPDIFIPGPRTVRDLYRKKEAQRPLTELPVIDNRSVGTRTSDGNRRIKVNFSSLADILHISALHCTIANDFDSSPLRWQIREVPFAGKDNQRRVWSLTGLPSKNGESLRVLLNQRRSNCVDVQAPVNASGRGFDRCPRALSQRYTTFMKHVTTSTGAGTVLAKTKNDEASYFKLVRQEDSSDNRGPENTNCSQYQLIPCSPSAIGCFRLSPTEAGEVGEYQLVPRDGYDSGDFRIVTSHSTPGCFVLLQNDHSCPGQYTPVVGNKTDSDKEFRLVQARIHETHAGTRYEAPKRFQKFDVSTEPYPQDDRYTFFNDTMHMSKYGEHSESYPDITLPNIQATTHAQWSHNTSSSSAPQTNGDCDDHAYRPMQGQPPVNNATKDVFIDQKSHDNGDCKSTDNSIYFLKAKYVSRYSEGSETRVNEQLSKLDFDQDKKQGDLEDVADVPYAQNSIVKWQCLEFDQWSRTRNGNQSSAVSLQQQLEQKETRVADERQSWLNEISMSADYRQWKKRKMLSVRMRAVLPPSDRKAVCIKLKDNSVTHERLKKIIEKHTGTKLIDIRFDPVCVHLQNSDGKCQWILRFSEESICDLLTISGINIDGATYRVRRFDDVMKEEYEAHKFYMIMKEIKERNLLKSRNDQKPKGKSEKRMRGAHTQTTTKLPNNTVQNNNNRAIKNTALYT